LRVRDGYRILQSYKNRVIKLSAEDDGVAFDQETVPAAIEAMVQGSQGHEEKRAKAVKSMPAHDIAAAAIRYAAIRYATIVMLFSPARTLD
jgi:hypothetical protein